MGAKCNQMYPYKPERKGDFTYKEEKTVRRQRQRLEGCCHKLRNAGDHQKLEKARNRVSLTASEGSAALLHLDFDPVTLILNFWDPEL